MTSNGIKARFQRDGFIRIRNILNFENDLKPVLNSMEFVMNRMVLKYVPRKLQSEIIGLPFKRKYQYLTKLSIPNVNQYFSIRYSQQNPTSNSDFLACKSIFNLIKNRKIHKCLEKILGSEIASNPVQNSRIKVPEKKLEFDNLHDGLLGRTPWHQDAAVLDKNGQKNTDLVTCWIPFTKTKIKNGCMLIIKESHKLGLLNHGRGPKGQVEIKNKELLDKIESIPLEADVGDIILMDKNTIHCSLPNVSKSFRISIDLRFNKAGQPTGREPLPSFYVASKNKKNITVTNYMQWITLWEKAKEKCISRKYLYKLHVPTFRGKNRDLAQVI